MKIAVVADSGSGIEPDYKRDNLFIIGMPFTIDDEEYFEGVNMDKEKFFSIISDGKHKLQTSQPSLYDVTKLWDNILKEYDQIIHICLSSGLSASYEQALRLSKEEEYNGRVFVPNHRRVSVTQRAAVDSALDMIEDGKDAKEISEYIENTGLESSIYIMVDTLTFLKNGGRVTPSAAALGNLLKIKPVLQIQGGRLDAYKKVISSHVAKKVIINAIKDDLNTRFKDLVDSGEIMLGIAHSNCLNDALEMEQKLIHTFPNLKIAHIDFLSNLISCHTGPGALGVGAFRVYKKSH